MGENLIFERIKSEGLAHISYFVGSSKEAVVIDPRRDCQVYLDLARRDEIKIKYVFKTHRNEDYAVGSCELAHYTSARVYHSPGLDFEYGETLKDGQIFHFGSMKLIAIHTPGHTDESTSYVLTDPALGDSAIMVFTGDTLFVGDVGRTDLYGPKEELRLSEALYDSIFNKILPLGDGVLLCPAHGAGSVCGGAISEREWSTLGLERLHNPLLQKTRDEFIKSKGAERLERPPYFKMMERYNLEGPPLLVNLPTPPAISPAEFRTRIKQGAQVLDTRTPSAFGGSHIIGSSSVWMEGLPGYAGWVLSYDKPILLVLGNKKQLENVVPYLLRLGYDRIEGYLCAGEESCGLESWYTAAYPFEHLGLLSVQELKERLNRRSKLTVLDVRTDKEWGEGHIDSALHIYVGSLKEHLDMVPVDKPTAVICSVGNRGSLAASILRQEGRQDVFNVLGGMTAWQKADYPIVITSKPHP
jgi:hydroxyacylglutathione hydrolase